MKAPIIGLAVATAAFAGSSLYLWQQVEQERARAAQVEETTRQLNARIAELEQARMQFGEHHLDAANAQASAKFGSELPQAPNAPTSPAENDEKKKVWTMTRSEPTPAMQKMMRTQIRARNKRLYADMSRKLGLDPETTEKLVDLLTEQQMSGYGAPMAFNDPAEAQRHYEESLRANDAAVADLIGPDKAVTLREYQETIPTRMEVEGLARQLADQEVPLSDSQRQKLLDVFLEERNRVPAPEYTAGMNDAEYSKAAVAWQNDYDKRVADQASSVLDSKQLATYNDIQQTQKDMREQMAAAGMTLPVPGVGRRFLRGGNFAIAAPAPAFVSGTFVHDGAKESTSSDKKP